MKLLEMLKKVPVFIRPLLLLVAFALVGSIAWLCSNLYVAQAQPSFAGFEPPSVNDKPNNTPRELAVWVDVSPSMYGFIYSNRSMCVPSSYRMVLSAVPDIAQQLSRVLDVTYYQFNSTFTLTGTDVSQQAQSDARNKHRSSATLVESFKQYQTLPVSGGSSTALPSVLNALDLSAPALILTDFEEDGLTQPDTEYEQPLKRIFDAGYCISVVAMKSAFSGMLFNYSNEGIDYTYGTAINSSSYKDAIQIAKPYPNHNQPRPFYAIVVGTAEQCKTMRNALTDSYTSSCKTNITDRIDMLNKLDGRKENTANFIEVKSVDYWLNDNTSCLDCVDGAAVSVTAEEGLTRNASSPWKDQGTLEYSITKNSGSSTQKASLAFSIAPEMACYATTYLSDVFVTAEPEVQKILENKVIDKDLEEDEKTLLGRGDKRVVLDMETVENHNKWFSCSDIAKSAGGITFTLNINVTDSEPGLYRITLPVNCRHSTEVADQSEISWVKSWSLRSMDLKAKLRAKEITASKTINLFNQLERIRKVDASQSSQKLYQVAKLTIDLIIR